MYFRKLLTIIFILTFSLGVSGQSFLSGKSFPEDSLVKEDVLPLFMGKTRFLPKLDDPMVIGIFANDEKRYNETIKSFFRMSRKQYQSYWRKKLFSGLAIPPVALFNLKSVLEFIEKNPNSIILTMEKVRSEKIKIINAKIK